jgi:hypothetical protein
MEYNIKMRLTEISYGDIDWDIDMDRDRCQAVVETTGKFRLS